MVSSFYVPQLRLWTFYIFSLLFHRSFIFLFTTIAIKSQLLPHRISTTARFLSSVYPSDPSCEKQDLFYLHTSNMILLLCSKNLTIMFIKSTQKFVIWFQTFFHSFWTLKFFPIRFSYSLKYMFNFITKIFPSLPIIYHPQIVSLPQIKISSSFLSLLFSEFL